MTHHYQYVSSLPHSKKKLNAAFVHRLKKLCGRVYHYRVIEVFGDEGLGDYVTINIKRQDAKNNVLALCSAYGIGSDYIDIYPSEFDNSEYIDIYLSQENPSSDGE
jgi:hypothetical protein